MLFAVNFYPAINCKINWVQGNLRQVVGSGGWWLVFGIQYLAVKQDEQRQWHNRVLDGNLTRYKRWTVELSVFGCMDVCVCVCVADMNATGQYALHISHVNFTLGPVNRTLWFPHGNPQKAKGS